MNPYFAVIFFGTLAGGLLLAVAGAGTHLAGWMRRNARGEVSAIDPIGHAVAGVLLGSLLFAGARYLATGLVPFVDDGIAGAVLVIVAAGGYGYAHALDSDEERRAWDWAGPMIVSLVLGVSGALMLSV